VRKEKIGELITDSRIGRTSQREKKPEKEGVAAVFRLFQVRIATITFKILSERATVHVVIHDIARIGNHKKVFY
jgi:hypothetical protein